ncbi:ribosome maturation factor RimM [Vogesella alkaliphila]|nr:ribosome maturation factor RimM [Vogesella alkaliphila]
MRDDDLAIMGFVRGAFGVRGWIKVHADTQFADSLFDYPVWWIGKENDWKPFTFKDGAVQPKNLVAQLEEVTGREQAEAMRGLKVAVPKAELPPAEEGEYYWSDLIGMDVINAEGLCLGKVVDLMETGANDVLVISGEHGQILIPFVAAYVGDVDTQSKQIKVEWGLDY